MAAEHPHDEAREVGVVSARERLDAGAEGELVRGVHREEAHEVERVTALGVFAPGVQGRAVEPRGDAEVLRTALVVVARGHGERVAAQDEQLLPE